MKNLVKGEEYRRTTVCIDSYENGVPIGRLYNQCVPEGRQFHGIIRFLLEMEKIFDELEFPQAFTELRSFVAPAAVRPVAPVTELKKGTLSTFTVRVLFRQNASWQGSVFWQEGGQEQCFRSVLELILLIDSALSYQDA